MIKPCHDLFLGLSLEQLLATLFVVFFLLEWMISKRRRLKIYDRSETISNLIIGLVSFVFDFLFSLLSLPLLKYLYTHFRWFELDSYSLFGFAVLFVLIDFVEYWFHRLSHEVNLLWSAHIVHHQSKHFNMSVGLRTSFFIPIFNIFFYLIFPVLGFHPDAIILVIFIQGIYQLLLHTTLVGQLGPLEKVLITPSLHRVHHGMNEQYLDKNYGKTLLVWDVLFKTHQKEEEVVCYGVKNQESDNSIFRAILKPIRIIFGLLSKAEYKVYKRLILFRKPEEVQEIFQYTLTTRHRKRFRFPRKNL